MYCFCHSIVLCCIVLLELYIQTQSFPLRPQHTSAAPTSDPPPEMIQSELTDLLNPDPGNQTPSPTSPLCLGKKIIQSSPFLFSISGFQHADLVSIVEGLDSLGLTDRGPGFFSTLQCQMESQLLADPEMLQCILGSPFVQNTLSTSSPQLTRELILSNPQIQQLLQTNPEVEDVLNNTDVITQVGIKRSV